MAGLTEIWKVIVLELNSNGAEYTHSWELYSVKLLTIGYVRLNGKDGKPFLSNDRRDRNLYTG